MPTQEELEAITRMCVRVTQALHYGMEKVNIEKLIEEKDITWKYINKVIAQKEKARTYSREHMREIRKTNPDYGHYYVPKKNGKGKTAKRGKNYKEYQHEYYLRVTKPKRKER